MHKKQTCISHFDYQHFGDRVFRSIMYHIVKYDLCDIQHFKFKFQYYKNRTSSIL
eukprot:UN00111